MFFTLFLKECKTVCRSIIYFVFIGALFLFVESQIGISFEDYIDEYYKPEGSWLTSRLIKPQEGQEFYGMKSGDNPEKVMPDVISWVTRNWKSNYYLVHNALSIGRQINLNDKKNAEIAQIIFDITGVEAEEIYNSMYDKMMSYPDGTPFNNMEFSELIPIKVTYEEFQEKMKRIDKILGGKYDVMHSNSSHGNVPLTYEEALAEYDDFINDDKITGAYARSFCDYMGIAAALMSVFVPVAFLIRDKRAKANELLFSRNISSITFILARYTALIVMMIVPFLLIGVLPTVQLADFAVKNNLPVDIFAFAKYTIAWILPTLMTTTAVAFIITTITDTPLAIAVQFIWSFYNISVGAFAAYASGRGLVYYGMNLLIRHNSWGDLKYYKDNFTQLAINRIFYTILSIVLIAVTIFIYEQKRRGEIDVRGSLRKIFRNRKGANQA